VENALAGYAADRHRISPRRPLVAGRGRSVGTEGGSAREANGDGPFIGDPRASSRPTDRRRRLGDACVRTTTDGPTVLGAVRAG
jgi:hypothetical protein